MTTVHLTKLVAALNTYLGQEGTAYKTDEVGNWTYTEDGYPIPNAGTYVLDQANGGVALNQMVKSGGQVGVFNRTTNVILGKQIAAMIKGVQVAQDAMSRQIG
tara:strand:- start:280 stop:588 length:309 start_codon:yes stop_codon:yes gene_type:complete